MLVKWLENDYSATDKIFSTAKKTFSILFPSKYEHFSLGQYFLSRQMDEANNLLWEIKHITWIFLVFFQTKVKLQRVRLMAEMFGCDHGMTFQKSTLSQIIMNSKSKECGPLRLHDVNPAASCHRSRTKIFILSFFKLVNISYSISRKGHSQTE